MRLMKPVVFRQNKWQSCGDPSRDRQFRREVDVPAMDVILVSQKSTQRNIFRRHPSNCAGWRNHGLYNRDTEDYLDQRNMWMTDNKLIRTRIPYNTPARFLYNSIDVTLAAGYWLAELSHKRSPRFIHSLHVQRKHELPPHSFTHWISHSELGRGLLIGSIGG